MGMAVMTTHACTVCKSTLVALLDFSCCSAKEALSQQLKDRLQSSISELISTDARSMLQMPGVHQPRLQQQPTERLLPPPLWWTFSGRWQQQPPRTTVDQLTPLVAALSPSHASGVHKLIERLSSRFRITCGGDVDIAIADESGSNFVCRVRSDGLWRPTVHGDRRAWMTSCLTAPGVLRISVQLPQGTLFDTRTLRTRTVMEQELHYVPFDETIDGVLVLRRYIVRLETLAERKRAETVDVVRLVIRSHTAAAERLTHLSRVAAMQIARTGDSQRATDSIDSGLPYVSGPHFDASELPSVLISPEKTLPVSEDEWVPNWSGQWSIDPDTTKDTLEPLFKLMGIGYVARKLMSNVKIESKWTHTRLPPGTPGDETLTIEDRSNFHTSSSTIIVGGAVLELPDPKDPTKVTRATCRRLPLSEVDPSVLRDTPDPLDALEHRVVMPGGVCTSREVRVLYDGGRRFKQSSTHVGKGGETVHLNFYHLNAAWTPEKAQRRPTPLQSRIPVATAVRRASNSAATTTATEVLRVDGSVPPNYAVAATITAPTTFDAPVVIPSGQPSAAVVVPAALAGVPVVESPIPNWSGQWSIDPDTTKDTLEPLFKLMGIGYVARKLMSNVKIESKWTHTRLPPGTPGDETLTIEDRSNFHTSSSTIIVGGAVLELPDPKDPTKVTRATCRRLPLSEVDPSVLRDTPDPLDALEHRVVMPGGVCTSREVRVLYDGGRRFKQSSTHVGKGGETVHLNFYHLNAAWTPEKAQRPPPLLAQSTTVESAATLPALQTSTPVAPLTAVNSQSSMHRVCSDTTDFFRFPGTPRPVDPLFVPLSGVWTVPLNSRDKFDVTRVLRTLRTISWGSRMLLASIIDTTYIEHEKGTIVLRNEASKGIGERATILRLDGAWRTAPIAGQVMPIRAMHLTGKGDPGPRWLGEELGFAPLSWDLAAQHGYTADGLGKENSDSDSTTGDDEGASPPSFNVAPIRTAEFCSSVVVIEIMLPCTSNISGNSASDLLDFHGGDEHAAHASSAASIATLAPITAPTGASAPRQRIRGALFNTAVTLSTAASVRSVPPFDNGDGKRLLELRSELPRQSNTDYIEPHLRSSISKFDDTMSRHAGNVVRAAAVRLREDEAAESAPLFGSALNRRLDHASGSESPEAPTGMVTARGSFDIDPVSSSASHVKPDSSSATPAAAPNVSHCIAYGPAAPLPVAALSLQSPRLVVTLTRSSIDRLQQEWRHLDETGHTVALVYRTLERLDDSSDGAALRLAAEEARLLHASSLIKVRRAVADHLRRSFFDAHAERRKRRATTKATATSAIPPSVDSDAQPATVTAVTAAATIAASGPPAVTEVIGTAHMGADSDSNSENDVSDGESVDDDESITSALLDTLPSGCRVM